MLRSVRVLRTAALCSTRPINFIRMASAVNGNQVANVTTEAKIAELGYKLPAPPKQVANYIMCNRVGNLIYTGK